MKRKYMVRCDVDGATGVIGHDQVDPAYANYEYGRRMMMGDLLALLAGLTVDGADCVIYDEHYNGANVDVSQLPTDVLAICGKPPYRQGWAGGLDASFDGVILLGFHSKKGTPGALMPHTYEPDIGNITINGVSVGEIGVEAAVAGDFHVPILLVVADSHGVAEAKALLPGVATVAVKEGMGEHSALCYSSARTAEMIRMAALDVARRPVDVRSYQVESPVVMEVDLFDGQFLNMMRKLYPHRMRDGRLVTVSGPDVSSVWGEYWQMKLCCQKEMA